MTTYRVENGRDQAGSCHLEEALSATTCDTFNYHVFTKQTNKIYLNYL